MKIKCISIEGTISDPLKNEEMMEKEIQMAKAQKVDLLVFPSNSLYSESIKDLIHNNTYQENRFNARVKLDKYIDSIKDMKIFYFDASLTIDEEKINIQTSWSGFENIKDIFEIEDEIRLRSKRADSLEILCLGRGTESVCQGIYPNFKIVAYKGHIISSNVDNEYYDGVITEIQFEDYVSRYPYLENINHRGTEGNRLFKRILNLQSYGLIKKLQRMGRDKIVIGVSGGLDSTVSLLACVEAFKFYHLPIKNIIGITMPGLGTTERTYQNALSLMKRLGITIYDIDLKPILKQHLNNLQQPENVFDLTYEQCQSRERTQVLLDFANKEHAVMIGTGCMSEFALGWMSYGGDHLSMYAINIGLPKTVVKMYASWFIQWLEDKHLGNIVKDILDGPVSPELMPVTEEGEQNEKTEDIIGDYVVHDFFIYEIIKNGYSLKKIFKLACYIFDEYSKEYIFEKLVIFANRFFTRQYKKNCYGDGIQIFDYSVSPFTFGVPSDVDNYIWQEELLEIKKELDNENL